MRHVTDADRSGWLTRTYFVTDAAYHEAKMAIYDNPNDEDAVRFAVVSETHRWRRAREPVQNALRLAEWRRRRQALGALHCSGLLSVHEIMAARMSVGGS